jgi:hypothetical protein
MVETGYVIRVGDSDDYHVEGELSGVVERLRMNRVGRLVGFVRRGVEAEGFRGENYISLFWGVHDTENGSTLQRELTILEFNEINRGLVQGH